MGLVPKPPPPPSNCTNLIKDGNETDKDCGGGSWADGTNMSNTAICHPCKRGKHCKMDADCESPFACLDKKCQKVKNGADNFIGAIIAMAGSMVGNIGTNVEK